MADLLYLSYWIDGLTEHNMFRYFDKALRLFPVSRLNRNPSTLRITPLSFSEPALFEAPLTEDFAPSDVLAMAKEFQHGDSCYEVDTAWDLWQFDGESALKPSPVSLFCFGPEFERDAGENLRVDFGLDSNFLPDPDVEGSATMEQSNLRSLNKYVHDLDDALGSHRRRLWTESGENFAERLQEALRSGIE